MKKFLSLAFWWTVAAVLILWPLGLCLGGEAKPGATAEQWVLDPDKALQLVVAQAKSLAQVSVSGGLLALVLGGLGTAVAILRLTPAWGPLLGFAWDCLAPKQIKLQEREQGVQAEGFRVLVKTIEKLPQDSTLGELRDKLARKMPDQVKQAVEAFIESRAPAPAPAPAAAPAIPPAPVS